MKSAVFAALAAAAACAFAGKTSTPAGFTDDLDAALRAAKDSKRPVVAVFSGSDWCCWCTRLEQEVLSDAAFLREATNRFELAFIDSPRDPSCLTEAAAKRNPGLTKKYGVEGFPAVLLLDAEGEVVYRTGYRPGGGGKYLQHLLSAVVNGPLVTQYVAPLKREGEQMLETFQDELRASFGGKRPGRKAYYAEMAKRAPAFLEKLAAFEGKVLAAEMPKAVAEERSELLDTVKSIRKSLTETMAQVAAEEKSGDKSE